MGATFLEEQTENSAVFDNECQQNPFLIDSHKEINYLVGFKLRSKGQTVWQVADQKQVSHNNSIQG